MYKKTTYLGIPARKDICGRSFTSSMATRVYEKIFGGVH
jgi:hypothetical protein